MQGSRAGAGDVKFVVRVIKILELLGRRSIARTHIQIAEELNIPKSSLTQVLKTLARYDYLEFDINTRGFSLGTGILDIAVGVRTTKQLLHEAISVLEWLTEQTGESAALNMRKGDQYKVAATVLSQQRIVAHLKLDDKAPLHARSGGQIILAHCTRMNLTTTCRGLVLNLSPRIVCSLSKPCATS
mgnify:CR=1 FL=1